MNSKAAVNNTYENYKMLVQTETLQDDWHKKRSRLNPMLHKRELSGEKMRCPIRNAKVQQ